METPMTNEDQVKDIIHRWRNTPEDNLKPEDYEQFKSLGSASLTQGDGAQLLEFLQEEKNQGMVRSMGCVLMAPLLTRVVKKEEESLDHCQAAITHLTTTCRPNPLVHSLLELIEDIDPGAISDTVLAVIPHLQTVLLQLDGDRKAASVGSALSGLHGQLARLPVPYTRPQEEADEHGLCRGYGALAALARPFVEEVKGGNGDRHEEAELRTELLKFCMRSLREPLLEAELNRDSKSPLWLFATEIMRSLPAIQEPPSELLFFSPPKTKKKRSAQLDGAEAEEARACAAYLLHVQLIGIDSFPAVFSPLFVLQRNLDYVGQLLSSKKESHLLKGLALFAKSLERVPDHSLAVGLLELKSFYSAPRNLREVLTDCPMQHLRQSGLQVFQLFIDKLDAEAKHKFFRCMLKTSNHAGVESYIIKNIRNQVEFSMKPGNADKSFLGAELLPLMGLVLCLPQGAETDLLTSMDSLTSLQRCKDEIACEEWNAASRPSR
ncbi:glomulin-like isoform X2 [Pseudoliparis swirei]|uniref:glomulin-like isoform X2 n=1 Tax=Pseudoliparis swirei TaxID=2059687 RepID=UPI0024BD9363|nr:glomulin-like isoform X2 [Pseudoliparis swirei]